MKYALSLVGLLMAWDGGLHLASFVMGHAPFTLLAPDPMAGMPWLLYPTFPTWAAYDLFWAVLHLGTAAVIFASLARSPRPRGTVADIVREGRRGPGPKP